MAGFNMDQLLNDIARDERVDRRKVRIVLARISDILFRGYVESEDEKIVMADGDFIEVMLENGRRRKSVK